MNAFAPTGSKTFPLRADHLFFYKRLGLQESKQEVTEVVSLVVNKVKNKFPVPLKQNYNYSQPCVKQAPMGKLSRCGFRQVLA